MSYGEAFYLVKGSLGLVGLGLLIVHMNRSWPDFDRETGGISQRLRYITLFYFTVLITSVSYDQIADGVEAIPWRSVGAMGGVVLLAVTAYFSIIEAPRRKR